jgi:hypothetical protein
MIVHGIRLTLQPNATRPVGAVSLLRPNARGKWVTAYTCNAQEIPDSLHGAPFTPAPALQYDPASDVWTAPAGIEKLLLIVNPTTHRLHSVRPRPESWAEPHSKTSAARVFDPMVTRASDRAPLTDEELARLDADVTRERAAYLIGKLAVNVLRHREDCALCAAVGRGESGAISCPVGQRILDRQRHLAVGGDPDAVVELGASPVVPAENSSITADTEIATELAAEVASLPVGVTVDVLDLPPISTGDDPNWGPPEPPTAEEVAWTAPSVVPVKPEDAGS